MSSKLDNYSNKNTEDISLYPDYKEFSVSKAYSIPSGSQCSSCNACPGNCSNCGHCKVSKIGADNEKT